MSDEIQPSSVNDEVQFLNLDEILGDPAQMDPCEKLLHCMALVAMWEILRGDVVDNILRRREFLSDLRKQLYMLEQERSALQSLLEPAYRQVAVVEPWGPTGFGHGFLET